ncbi:uncharacterized protein LOC133737809 [Rosa rugosa]|uniref:uncharacterized protein LOC133737809 n=1 Tax=Rosa rugosa TaxID=74645 RepID=UPI002B410911|nr:uncharacterized protein LOC133737809 [Rosa rugosa]
MFFFHVFSGQRIDLPEFPVPELTDHVAAVSCPPSTTSQDCVVCVISRSRDAELEAKVLHLGEDQAWIESKHSRSRVHTDTIKCAVYHTGMGMFCFFDRAASSTMITISTEKRPIEWKCIEFGPAKTEENVEPSRSKYFTLVMHKLKNNFKDMKKKRGLTEDVSISTCGTITPSKECWNNFIYNESISDNDDESKNRCFKGVWIQPTFSQNSFKDDEEFVTLIESVI